LPDQPRTTTLPHYFTSSLPLRFQASDNNNTGDGSEKPDRLSIQNFIVLALGGVVLLATIKFIVQTILVIGGIVGSAIQYSFLAIALLFFLGIFF